MSKIRQKRIVELVKEYEDASLIELSEKRLVAQKDEELFTVDTAGRQSRKRKARLDFSEARSPLRHPPSKAESRLVKKLLVTSRPSPAKKDATSLSDLWGDCEQVTAVDSVRRPSSVALPGQSYNPTPRDHQNILAEAVALEIIKRENAERFDKPVAVSTTDAVVSQQSQDPAEDEDDEDGDEEEEEADEDGDDGSAEGRRPGAGRPKTLTRAQRNKKRRRSEESHRQLSEERHRRLLQSIDQLPKILQEMAASDKRRSARKAALQAKKKASSAASLTYEQSAEVPLSDELCGSLRQLRPKGRPLGERLRLLRSSGRAAPAPRLGGQRAHMKPHAAKRVVWHAKYKYE
eukprot:gene31466-40866_t